MCFGYFTCLGMSYTMSCCVRFAYHFQRGTQITVMVYSYIKMIDLHATEFIGDNVVVTPDIQTGEVTVPTSTETTLVAVSLFYEHLAALIRTTKIIRDCGGVWKLRDSDR